MKKMILAVVVLGVTGGLIFLTVRSMKSPVPESIAIETPSEQTIQEPPVEEKVSATPVQGTPELARVNVPAEVSASMPTPLASNPSKAIEASEVKQAVALLISPTASFAQKQVTWTQLRESGKLDEAIAELEQQFKTNPTVAEYPAALGQAFLNKIQTTQDVRDHAILGMSADRSFEDALNLDASNWEARFFKTTAMTYWPESMNKGAEVIEQFSQLILQQEKLPAQPQFAQTYVLLGQQYHKLGEAGQARQIWQRGAMLFPSDQTLRKKLAGQP